MKKQLLIIVILLGTLLNVGFTKTTTQELGTATYTDTKVFINKVEIPVYDYNGKAVIKVYQLNYYGFNIHWNGINRTFEITYDHDKAIKGLPIVSRKNGKKYGNVKPSEIKATIFDESLPTYILNSNIVIPLESLKPLGIITHFTKDKIFYFTPHDAKIVKLHNEEFEQMLRDKLEKPEGNLSMKDLDTIVELQFSNFDSHGYDVLCEDIALLRNLKTVFIEGIKQWTIDIQDLSPLAQCKSIEGVYIHSSMIRDLSPLKELPLLKKLSIMRGFSPVYFDLETIKDLKNLETLYISGQKHEPINLDIFSNLKMLKKLSIIGSVLDNLDNTHFEALTTLYLENCSIASGSFNAPYLEELTFINQNNNGNSLMDMSPFKNLSSLNKIYIHMTDLNNIDDIVHLTNLEEVQLPLNKITDITPILQLPNLLELAIQSNPIEDYSILDQLENIEIKSSRNEN